jgi:hypothetical protein
MLPHFLDNQLKDGGEVITYSILIFNDSFVYSHIFTLSLPMSCGDMKRITYTGDI